MIISVADWHVTKLFAMTLAVVSMPTNPSPMMAAWPYEFIVRYDNGDELRVSCGKDLKDCTLHLVVGKDTFAYGVKELGGLELLPGRGALYSGAGSLRERYFSFEVSVSCPTEPSEPPFPECFASAVVAGGKLGQIQLLRKFESNIPPRSR